MSTGIPGETIDDAWAREIRERLAHDDLEVDVFTMGDLLP